MRDRMTKISRGFAFVEFHTLPAAKAACESKEPIIVDGQTVRCSFARDVKGSSSNPTYADPSIKGDGYEFAQKAHKGTRIAGFGIPAGFVPDKESGYYYSAESGYFFDAEKKLYYHPTTGLWYETDPVTGVLKEHVSEEQQAAIDAANAAAIAAKTAEADAARAAAAATAEAAAAKAAAEPAPLVENHSKVVLGLGKGKKGVARATKQPVGVFKQAVAEEEAPEEKAAKEAKAKLAEEEAAMVSWEDLICNFCRRKFKDAATLTKHTESSELHASNLATWKAEREAEVQAAVEKAAAAANAEAAGMSNGVRHWTAKSGMGKVELPPSTERDRSPRRGGDRDRGGGERRGNDRSPRRRGERSRSRSRSRGRDGGGGGGGGGYPRDRGGDGGPRGGGSGFSDRGGGGSDGFSDRGGSSGFSERGSGGFSDRGGGRGGFSDRDPAARPPVSREEDDHYKARRYERYERGER